MRSPELPGCHNACRNAAHGQQSLGGRFSYAPATATYQVRSRSLAECLKITRSGDSGPAGHLRYLFTLRSVATSRRTLSSRPKSIGLLALPSNPEGEDSEWRRKNLIKQARGVLLSWASQRSEQSETSQRANTRERSAMTVRRADIRNRPRPSSQPRAGIGFPSG